MSSPKKYYDSLPSNTVYQAIKSENKPIAYFRKHFGEIEARALLTIFLTDVCGFFNTKSVISVLQMAQTIELILKEYPHFKPDDFKICFGKAMLGKYGKVYDRIDGSIIMEWLLIYSNERIEAAQHLSEQLHLQSKNGIPPGEISEKALENIRAILEVFKEKPPVVIQVEKVAPIQRKKTPGEVLMDAWIVEFDKMYADEKFAMEGKIRAINFEGKTFDLNAFINHKHDLHINEANNNLPGKQNS